MAEKRKKSRDCGKCDKCDQRLAVLLSNVNSAITARFVEASLTILNSSFDNINFRLEDLFLLHFSFQQFIKLAIERFQERCNRGCCKAFVVAIKETTISYFNDGATLLSTSPMLAASVAVFFSELLLDAYAETFRILGCSFDIDPQLVLQTNEKGKKRSNLFK